MIMICNVPDEVVKSVKMGTWCGSSVAEKMIANGIPLDKIRADIDIARFIDKDTKVVKNANASGLEVAMRIIDKYKAEKEDK